MIYFLTISILSFIVLKRQLTYLHFLQQDTYHVGRFLKWLIQNRAYDHYMTITLMLAGLCTTALAPRTLIGVQIAAWTTLFILMLREPSPFKQAKKPLVMTARAKRIYITSLVFSIPMIVLPQTYFSLILTIQAIPLILAIACVAMLPIESWIQRQLRHQAQQRLQALNPIVIGVTGSFGKTSMKHILYHLLSKYKPCLMTPGSVNTPMGICRIINTQLTEKHAFFIVEMGAYQRGSIAKICHLTHPQIGVVTSIGPCHLERFGSIENITHAKAELLTAVTQHKNCLGFTFPDTLKTYSVFRKHAAQPEYFPPIHIKHKTQELTGLTLEGEMGDQLIHLQAPIYGLHQADNIVLAASIAQQLGMPLELIQSALRSLNQIKARLEVKHEQQNITWINDGFNANPSGVIQGIHLLAQFGQAKGGRTILVTPGITELGPQHNQVHEDLAKKAIEKIDIIIAVAAKRIQSFVTTCNTYKKSNQLILEVNGYQDANTWLKDNTRPGDTILLANDLPDILEKKPNI